jgi:hypothetical protein
MKRWVDLPVEDTPEGLVIGAHSVVEHWEQPIQQALANELCSTTGMRVIEVGYGLGMASRAIAAAHPLLHLIIEAHPEIARRAVNDCVGLRNAVVVNAMWEVMMPELRSSRFDALLFDSYPLDQEPFDGSATACYGFIEPFIEASNGILAPHGVIGFLDFSSAIQLLDEFRDLLQHGFEIATVKSVSISPRASCGYAVNNTANVVVIRRSIGGTTNQ